MKVNSVIYFLVVMIFLFSLLLMFNSIQRFDTGFHNADSGQNLKRIKATTGINFIDVTSDGTKTGQELYILGMEQIKTNYIISTILSFLLGFLLMWIILNRF